MEDILTFCSVELSRHAPIPLTNVPLTPSERSEYIVEYVDQTTRPRFKRSSVPHIQCGLKHVAVGADPRAACRIDEKQTEYSLYARDANGHAPCVGPKPGNRNGETETENRPLRSFARLKARGICLRRKTCTPRRFCCSKYASPCRHEAVAFMGINRKCKNYIKEIPSLHHDDR